MVLRPDGLRWFAVKCVLSLLIRNLSCWLSWARPPIHAANLWRIIILGEGMGSCDYSVTRGAPWWSAASPGSSPRVQTYGSVGPA